MFVRLIVGFVMLMVLSVANAAPPPKGFMRDTRVVDVELCEKVEIIATALAIDNMKSNVSVRDLSQQVVTALLNNETKDPTSWAVFHYIAVYSPTLHNNLYSKTYRLNWLNLKGNLSQYPDFIGGATYLDCKEAIGTKFEYLRPINGRAL
ncbi:hypothetical protein [Pseudomonas aeruginosa]|uniref:hypothetical protein n=1 Tax=Pseudomonas aeruginosa TaxID=287 RepID=UPI0010C329F5|nr:hypothetical protein [Pseudomonas aeruginosa]QBX32458.1 hypothetical protein [Pseudomonas phage PA1C]